MPAADMSQMESGSEVGQSAEDMSQEVESTGAMKKHIQGEPGLAPIVAVQFLFMLAQAISASNFPFIWTTLPWSRGEEVRGATLSTFSVFANALAEFLSASLVGVMSDNYGRKPFLIVSCVGQVIDFTTAGLATKSPWGDYPAISAHAHPMLWMLSARVVAGLCGNLTIFTKAYMGDVSTAATGSRNFALLFACMCSSFVVGMPLGGLLSKMGLGVPMFVASALNLVNIFLIGFCLQESLRPEHRAPIVWRKANPVGALQFLLSTRFLLLFGAMTFLDQFSLSLLQSVFFQYCKIVFGVDKRASIGLIITFAVASILSLVAIRSPRLLKRYGEMFILRLGYLLTCAAFACLALVSYTKVFLLMFPCLMILAMGMVSGPVQTAIAARCVKENQQGALQAANGSLDVIGKMVSAGLVTGLFQPIMKINQPGIIWWIACLTATGGVWSACNLHRFLPATFTAFPLPPSDAREP